MARVTAYTRPYYLEFAVAIGLGAIVWRLTAGHLQAPVLALVECAGFLTAAGGQHLVTTARALQADIPNWWWAASTAGALVLAACTTGLVALNGYRGVQFLAVLTLTTSALVVAGAYGERLSAALRRELDN